MMDELYRMLKDKLDEMIKGKIPVVSLTFDEVSMLYQQICMMKQVREIVKWCDNGYS